MDATPDYAHFFQLCAESGPHRLYDQAWQFRAELLERGKTAPLPDVEDALFELARERLPESPGGTEEAGVYLRDEILRRALQYANRHYVEGSSLSALDDPGERVNVAYADGSFGELREAARAYVRAALEEFRRAKGAA